MLDTICIPESTIRVADRRYKYHSFDVPSFFITPTPISTGDWSKVMGKPHTGVDDLSDKLFYTKNQVDSLIATLSEATNSVWRVPSETELDAAYAASDLELNRYYWTLLADAWTGEFDERPKDGSPYPSVGHTRNSRLVKKGNICEGEPLLRAWVTYSPRRWSVGLTTYLVSDTESQNDVADVFNWLNIPC
jgi:hypothetical protein